MRMMKLALIAAAALLAGSVSASAVTVKKRTEAPGLPPQIWEQAGAFCAIKDWHPLVADCAEEKEGDVTYRILTLKDGGKIKEKLTATEDLSYSYEIIESPLPVQNYKAKLWLETDDEPDRSVIFWQADFDPKGASEDDAKKTIAEIFAAGVKGIKQKAIAAHDAREGKTSSEGDKDDDEK
jgi:polyketide cyclase/dehydrase/lipid transport protein